MTSDKVENIHSLWSLYVGEFHNDDHPLIKRIIISANTTADLLEDA